jgi:hypothetical protein
MPSENKVQTANLSVESKRWFEQAMEHRLDAQLAPVIGRLDTLDKKLDNEVVERKDETGQLDEKMAMMGKKMLQMERELCRRNVIIMGVDKEVDLGRQVVNLAKDKLGLDWFTGDHVEACWALSKGENGPIKVVCTTWLVANSLLVSRRKLTGTNMRMKNDLPWAISCVDTKHLWRTNGRRTSATR